MNDDDSGGRRSDHPDLSPLSERGRRRRQPLRHLRAAIRSGARRLGAAGRDPGRGRDGHRTDRRRAAGGARR